MRAAAFLLFILIVMGFSFRKPKLQTALLFEIPAQTFDAWDVLQETKMTDTVSVDSFNITGFITLAEYRVFLADMKRDSGEKFWRTLLPDSSIGSAEDYKRYFNSSRYDNFPVCGISWVNACRYCDWRTLKENGDSIKVVYRLPYLKEWLAAYRYLSQHSIVNDMNSDYSDWLLEAMDETYYSFSGKSGHFAKVDYTFGDNPNDPPVLRRKRFIGNSFHLQHYYLKDFLGGEYGYSFRGYSYIGFRAVKIRGNELYKWKWSDWTKSKKK